MPRPFSPHPPLSSPAPHPAPLAGPRAQALAALALALLPALGAQAQEVVTDGVRYEAAATVGSSPVVLNGAGTRHRAMFKVYTAGLYLPAKTASPEQAVTQPGAKRIHVHMLRNIDASELGRLFTRGMQDNAPREEFAKSLPGTVRMGEIFAAKKRLAPGETFTVDYVPGTGTTVRVNGKVMGELIPEPEFFQSLLRIWLGKSPADPLLKDALLGKAAARQGPAEN